MVLTYAGTFTRQYMDPFDAECLLIALGFRRFLSQEPIRTTIAKRDEALRCPKRIEQEMRAFLDKGTLSGTPVKVDFDYETVRKQVDRGINVPIMSGKLGGIQSEESSEMAITIARPWEFLKATLPQRSRQTPLGIEYGRPSDREIAKFRWGYTMAVDPLAALQDMQSGSLTFIESKALSETYPAVYAYMRDTLLRLIMAKKASDEDYRLPRQHARMLDALWQIRSFDMGIAAKLQQSFVTEKEEAKPPPRKPAAGLDVGAQTQTQVSRISTER